MKRQTLHEDWLLAATAGPVPEEIAGRTVPAQVPGSVHTDLLAAGLIGDPYLDTAEAGLTWIHRTAWRYTLAFDAEAPQPGERVDLAFDGLDTVATVRLNGHRIGSTANMHRTYRFDVRDALRGGANELTVDFAPALDHAERERERLGHRPHTNAHPYNMIRKMACSFGWDWGPDLQTAGIFRPVRLERWTGARITGVRPLVTVGDDGTGRVEAHVGVEHADPAGAAPVVTARAGGREARVAVPAGASEAVAVIEVPDARLWWPAGYGDQPLYDLDVALSDAGGAAHPQAGLDAAHRRIGFRTVAVDTSPDAYGAGFTVTVNGRPVAVKGANWIPDDHFLTRITREHLQRRVDQALGAHMNMLRVWGGGIYETEDFYDVCDERGVLVWQDFALACAAYPEEEPLAVEFEAEARENVARLSSHASLAVWNGGNENLWGFADWGWQRELAGATWGEGYYYDLFPRVVAELDPTRPYVEGSPCSPGHRPGGVHPNDPDHGCRHEWEVWNQVDYTHYRDTVPRFCAEFGFQGPPTWTTLTTWIHDAPLTPTSPAFLMHQKAADGNGKLHRGMQGHLPVPEDFADWHWAAQLNQARAVAFGVEHYRSWWPRTAGTLVWQLNDCWPVTSWAAVDGDGRPKPLYYALRRAYAPRLLTFQPRDSGQALIAVNDTDAEWHGGVQLQRQDFSGAVLDTASIGLAAGARSAVRLEVPASLLTPADPSKELLVAATDDARTVHTFREDVELSYDPAPLSAQVTAVPEGYRVDVHAHSFARDVAILADRVAPDAEADDMLVSVPAGRTHSFTVRTAARIAPERLTDPQVLRCANGLAAHPTGAA
ncbi:glycoside hydrolase family 2 protein [Streptomonospora salina]|uniref:beta-mannosidase n=1 Tax=Streptomonospora salina TaxID=104205 RepID=A0A841EEF9_9ACTN|nr:glycoside hydrolase family 2 protein [Streptomonospora salina]MBB5999719.1 beta-mannosidase [Streptomonospora salina]